LPHFTARARHADQDALLARLELAHRRERHRKTALLEAIDYTNQSSLASENRLAVLALARR
jgi:hypothetical protein